MLKAAVSAGCETLTISAGAKAAERALRRRKLAWFYATPLAGFLFRR
jgi:hypothetical protein